MIAESASITVTIICWLRAFPRIHAVKIKQEIRLKYRWEAIDQENDAIEKAKKSKVNFEFKTLSNGDTLKQ